MKIMFTIASIVLLAAFLGMPSTGCATLGLKPVQVSPQTLTERVTAAQHDLDDAWKAAQVAHNFGLLSDERFRIVETAYPAAQSAINLAAAAASSNQPDALDMLLEASKAVKVFRDRVPAKAS